MMRYALRLAIGIGIVAVITASVAYNRYTGPFKSACTERIKDKKYTKDLQIGLCDTLEKRFFVSRHPIQEISPASVQSPPLPIDHNVKFLVFYDPAYLSSFAYCYFSFRGWFNPKEMSPKQISLAASGFSILKSELAGYPEWLKTENGAACVKSLQSSIHLDPADLAKEMSNKVSIIAFNPVGAIRSDDGLESVLKEAQLTINHERIHAIHVSCPDVDRAASRHWESLNGLDKENLKKGHLNYDWNNRIVAVREAFAYLLEDRPLRILEYIGRCSL